MKITFNRYLKQEKVGEGTYGSVYRSIDRVNNQTVAVKKIRIGDDDNGIPQTALREIAILKELVHPNIVYLQDTIFTDNKLYLIFEYFPYDLKRYTELNPLSPQSRKHFLKQILQAINFCHIRRVIHRDLKPQNILVSQNIVKIADFGLSRSFGLPYDTLTHEVVTLWYRAPEILLGAQTYSISIDIWSIGCIFAEMIQKKPLFMGDSEIDQLFKIFQVLGTPGHGEYLRSLPEFKNNFPKWRGKGLENVIAGIEEDELDLLKKMLAVNPDERISAAQALEHSLFEENF